jgi:hypothetical protein
VHQRTDHADTRNVVLDKPVDSMNPYGNTLALAVAGNEILKSNGTLKVTEPLRPAAAVIDQRPI